MVQRMALLSLALASLAACKSTEKSSSDVKAATSSSLDEKDNGHYVTKEWPDDIQFAAIANRLLMARKKRIEAGGFSGMQVLYENRIWAEIKGMQFLVLDVRTKDKIKVTKTGRTFRTLWLKPAQYEKVVQKEERGDMPFFYPKNLKNSIFIDRAQRSEIESFTFERMNGANCPFTDNSLNIIPALKSIKLKDDVKPHIFYEKGDEMYCRVYQTIYTKESGKWKTYEIN